MNTVLSLSSFITLCLLLAPLFGLEPAHADTVIRCKDSDGNWQYTDDRRRCDRNAGEQQQEIEVKLHNRHSHYGALESEEYFNYAFRNLVALDDYRIEIIVEGELLEKDPDLVRRAATRLEDNVLQALNLFPERWRHQFDGVKYYIFAGDKSSYGGGRGGLWYFREGNKVSERLDNSIIVRSAHNYATMSDLWALKSAVHELAHGFHYYNWERIASPVYQAYLNAEKNDLYTNVSTHKGKTLRRAYARKNHMEYFAELTTMLFARCHYFPFDSADLREYDPEGFEAVRNAWMYW